MVKVCILRCHASLSQRKYGFPLPNSNLLTSRLNEVRRKRWFTALGLKENFRYDTKYVCGRHFISGKPARATDINSPDWVPSLCLPLQTTSQLDPNDAIEENVPKVSRPLTPSQLLRQDLPNPPRPVTPSQLQRQDLPSASRPMTPSSQLSYQDLDEELYQSDSSYSSMLSSAPPVNEELERANVRASEAEEKLENYKKELENTQRRCFGLEQALLASRRGLEFLADNDDKCKYYTGIDNFQVLKKLYNYLKPYLDDPMTNFGSEQVFIMTLSKLRLNVPLTTLGYDFGVSTTTASKYFHRSLYVIYTCCKYALQPTDSKNLPRHSPNGFTKTFGSRRVFIVDCFEIRCETPGNIKAAAGHYSNYKHTHTVKFLIAVHPDGTIAFVSNGFTGRYSDREITLQSGFLDLLQENDAVLADKGFNISDIIGQRKATLNIPSFLRGKNQFAQSELETDKQITTLRIHVERWIGLLRNKYQCCSGPILVDTMARFQNGHNIIDLMVKVSCILCNLNKSIITA